MATKVTFCNEMYDIAMALGADYNLAREVWIADPRIGASHTFVYEDNRGYRASSLGRSEFYLWDAKSKKSIYVSVCANRD